MEAKQRLTIASTWLFEDIGVQEIRDRYKLETHTAGDTVEYAADDEAFVIKTNDIEKSTSSFGNLMPEFIDEQRNKDLLDMPRVHRLEVSDIVDIDGIESHESTPEKNRRATLLAFDDDSDQETVPVPSIRYTKYWLSTNGGLGCFECAFEDVLAEVARLTGTNISVKDDIKRIQVSGNSEEDVVDALEKLSRIEKPLSFAARPGIAHILQAPTDDGVRFRISNCSSVNDVALRRILVDPTANMTSRLRQMYIALLLNFDSETQLYVLPDNLKAPTPCTSQPGRSRIWQDFKFQEIGNGESYLALEADAEKEASVATESCDVEVEFKDSSSDIASEVPVTEHPYLTEEQVKEVGRWVSEGWKKGAVGADLKQEIAPLSKPSKDMERGQVPAAEPKKVAGIKTRRPLIAEEPLISGVHTPGGKIMKETVPSTETSGSRSPEKKDAPDPPDHGRKRWVMTFDASPSQKASSQENNDNTALSQAGMTGHSDFDVASNQLIPETPEGLVYISGIKFPTDFDRNKYGSPGKSPAIQKRQSGGNSKRETPSKSMQLIDIFSPSDTSLLPSDQRILSFDQPALIPVSTTNIERDDPFTTEAVDNDGEGEKSPSSDYETAPSESGISGTAPENAPYYVGNDTLSSRRIQELRNALQTQELEEELDIASVASTLPRPCSIANSMYKERLADLERASKNENKQSTDERASRQFRRTMGHRAPKPETTSSSKAAMKAKRQATLEDAWGMRPGSSRKPDVASAEDKKASENKKQQLSGTQIVSHKKEKTKQEESNRTEDSLKRLFDALQPILDAAQSFPGKLSLEMQIGLILIPLLPKTYKGDLISSDEWNKIFNPRAGVFAPSTNFVQRVTSSGADVDHIVDLKTSKAEGKRRLFDQEYTDYAVLYEYHCRAKNDQAIILVIDEAGNITVRKPAVTLGAVNIHFPGHTWDVNAVVSGFTEQIRGSDKELDEAIAHITDNLWIPPDRSLLRLYTRIPEGNELNVDKVLMKRFTLHRSLRSESDTDSHHKIPGGVKQVKQVSQADTSEPNTMEEESQQDVYLKITEVQDLWTGVTTADNRALRARCGPANEMIEKGRLWYEVSIVSPAIEDVLHSNSSLEVGECTQDWSPTDLMGNEAHIVLQGNAKKGKVNGKNSMQIPSPIATAIGSAGIGEMFRVASTVVQKMDSVGFWNLGPGLEAARNADGFEALFSTNNFPAMTVTGAPSMAMVKADPKGKNFEDLESVKEMESASVVGEKEVLDFW